MSDKNSPRLFRRILVDGNGGEIEIKANRQQMGVVHVFAVTRQDGQRTGISTTEVFPDDAAGLAECERVAAELLSLGWHPKSQRARVGTFSLTVLPAPAKAA
jgi:predicted RNase H-like nuclease